MKNHSILMITILVLLLTCFPLNAQDTNVTVPDVTGMSIPQAVSTLNRNGLNMGVQTPAENTDDIPVNTIVSQSIEAGASVAYGTAVDVTAVLPPNARLIYDDNDITLINLTPQQMATGNLIFSSVDDGNVSYSATSFWGNTLEGNRCFQLWSISRNEPKSVEGCDNVDSWRTTNNPQYHFWTQANNVSRFVVIENGVERANCPAAQMNTQDRPVTCEFYLAGGGRGEIFTDYVYFAYTADAITLINTSDEKYMETDVSTIYNYNPALATPGSPLIFGDTNFLREEFRQNLGDITELAPGQCLLYTLEGSGVTEPPEDCDVIAQRDMSPDLAFWVANFEVRSVMDNGRRLCPAPTPDKLTRCILQK